MPVDRHGNNVVSIVAPLHRAAESGFSVLSENTEVHSDVHSGLE